MCGRHWFSKEAPLLLCVLILFRVLHCPRGRPWTLSVGPPIRDVWPPLVQQGSTSSLVCPYSVQGPPLSAGQTMDSVSRTPDQRCVAAIGPARKHLFSCVSLFCSGSSTVRGADHGLCQ